MNAFLKHYLSKTLKSLIELRQIVESGGTTVNICSYVQTYTGIRQSNNHIIWQYIHGLFKVWPEYSGNTVFPVPHPSLSPGDGFLSACGDMWNGEYGAARKRLLDFMIDTIQDDVTKKD